jgi:arylsulfatase A-like enzyme
MSIRLMLVAAVLFLAGVPAFSQSAAGDRPNVLLICIDDLNDWIGCLEGHPQAVTPNIDRLAARGVLFTNAHCQAPVCLASRASFMSGNLPSTTGVYLLGPGLRESPELKGVKTMPEWFADQGYKTMGTGKIYHGGGNQETFQTYGPRGNAGPVLRGDDKLNYKQGHPLWDWGAYPEKDEQMPDFVCAQWAVERLKEKHDKPLFLAVGFNRPHVPMYAPQKWFDMQVPLDEIELPATHDNDRDDLPAYGKRLTAGFPAPRHEWMVANDQWKKAVRAYLACITFVDAQVGKVLDALDASGRAENTVVVLLSDHGFHMGEKQRWAKRTLWEESARVPLIVAGPGIEPDRQCAQPAGLIDLYPTLIELCGLQDPGHLEGQTLVPQLKDVDTPHAPAVTTWWVGNHSVRSERYRYIRYADGSEELYDHQNDPNEWHNLIAIKAAKEWEYKDILAYHRKFLPKVDRPALNSNAALGVAPEDREFFGVRH